MNRKDIRNAIFAETDWAPEASPEAVERLNGFINRAYQQLSLRAPFLFFDSILKIHTEPDVEPASAADTITMVTVDPGAIVSSRNPWVFYTDLATSGAGTEWRVDRSWDGRILDIIPADGVPRTVRIQSIWKQTVADVERYFISIEVPWAFDELGTGPFAWRVHTPTYYLPDDVVQIKGAALRLSTAPFSDLTVLEASEARRRGLLEELSATANGPPTTLFRKEHRQIMTPNTAPEVLANTEYSASEAYEWVGPEPVGEFDYCFTLAHGKRDHEMQSPGPGLWYTGNTPHEEDSAEASTLLTEWGVNRMRTPLFESAPSPIVSATVAPPVEAGAKTPAVKLLFPNIEYMLGYMLTGGNGVGTFRRITTSHSGWHIRIYRRRRTESFTRYSEFNTKLLGAAVTGLRKLDIRDGFYLLAEMRTDQFNTGMFIDNGFILPDLRTPLREIHGYMGVGLWPRPDVRCEVELYTTRKAHPLESDQDVPQLHPEAIDVLINLSLATVYRHLKDPSSAADSARQAEADLQTLRKRYGTLRPSSAPRYRRTASANTTRTHNGRFRR